MAISRFRAAGGFGQSMNYCFREKASIIGGNLVPVNEFDELERDDAKQVIKDATDAFKLTEFTNPGIQKNYYHVSISLALGEDLSDRLFAEMAYQHAAGIIALSKQPELADQPDALGAEIDRVREEKLSRYQMVVIRHTDKPHNHIHYLQSRVDLESGRAIRSSNERYHAQSVMRLLEDRFQLQRGQNSWDKKQPEAEKKKVREYQQKVADWLKGDIHLLQQLEHCSELELGTFKVARKPKNVELGLDSRTNVYRAEDLEKGQAKHGFAARPALILYDDGTVGGHEPFSREEAGAFKGLLLGRIHEFEREGQQSQRRERQQQRSRDIER